jgi:hypothetical protein
VYNQSSGGVFTVTNSRRRSPCPRLHPRFCAPGSPASGTRGTSRRSTSSMRPRGGATGCRPRRCLAPRLQAVRPQLPLRLSEHPRRDHARVSEGELGVVTAG